jgi:transposase
VADRFHVIRRVNQHFFNAWQQHDPEVRRNRGFLSLMRRHEWRLSSKQLDNLGVYLDDFPVLKAMYEAKQQLNHFLLLKTLTRKRAKRALPKLLGLIEQLSASPLYSLANTITS